MRLRAIPVTFAILLTSACSKSGPTTVGGDVALHLDPVSTASISLPIGTTLPPKTGSSDGGQLVGRCVVATASTDVELERTGSGDAGAGGFAWFRLHIDSPEAPQVAHVLADFDGDLYEADCDVASFARSPNEGALELTIAGCELMTPTPAGSSTTTLDANLSFAGCTER